MARSVVARVAPIAFVALFSLGVYACQDSTAPGTGGGKVDLTVHPVFLTDAAQQAVSIKRAHGIVRRAGGSVALDTTVDYAPAVAQPASRLDLAALTASPTITFHVELAASSPASGEDFTIELELVDASGNVVFRGGPVAVHAAAGQALPPVDITQLYTGPGASASAISVAPTTATIVLGASTDLTGRATDATGAQVPSAPIFWTSLDPAVASITNPLTGHVTGTGRGTGADPGVVGHRTDRRCAGDRECRRHVDLDTGRQRAIGCGGNDATATARGQGRRR